MRRWLVPSLAVRITRLSWAEDVPEPGRARRNAPATQMSAVQHEDVSQTLVFSQATFGTAGPLAMNRYRR